MNDQPELFEVERPTMWDPKYCTDDMLDDMLAYLIDVAIREGKDPYDVPEIKQHKGFVKNNE